MTKTALVIDDSSTTREIVSYSLREAGFDTLTANDGQQALEVLTRRSVDLIISELNMPVMDGLTFVRQVRLRDDLRGVPILMLTTESQAAMKEEGRQAGVTGWLVKPFNPEMLLKVIAKVVP